MVKPRLRKRLGDLLVEEGVISNDQLMAALKNQKGKGIKLGASLIDLGYINEEQLLKFLAKQLNIPFYDLSKVKIDQAAVQLIPEVQARRLRVLCIHAEPDRATVVMSDPADLNAMDCSSSPPSGSSTERPRKSSPSPRSSRRSTRPRTSRWEPRPRPRAPRTRRRSSSSSA